MTTTEQLLQAKQNCLTALARLEEANKADGVDRSGSVASIKRDLGSYERQLTKLGYVDPVDASAPETKTQPPLPPSPPPQPTLKRKSLTE